MNPWIPITVLIVAIACFIVSFGGRGVAGMMIKAGHEGARRAFKAFRVVGGVASGIGLVGLVLMLVSI